MNQYKTIAIFTLIIAGGLLSWFIFKNNGEKTTESVSNNQYAPNQNTGAQTDGVIKLEEQTNNEGGLSIAAKPTNFAFEKPVQIEITFTTHQGDINFDPTKQTVLISGSGQSQPISWSGGNGGHHLSGFLIFPPLSKGNAKMTLVIKDIYGVEERTFLWNLI